MKPLAGWRIPSEPITSADWAEAVIAGVMTLIAAAAWTCVIVALLA
jgi:hypothetical protein